MDSGTHIKPDRAMILIQKCIEARFCLRSRIKKLFFSTPLWHFLIISFVRIRKSEPYGAPEKTSKKETLKKSTLGGNAVNKPPQAALREKLQKNLIKSMPEKNPVLYASLGEKGRKKKAVLGKRNDVIILFLGG